MKRVQARSKWWLYDVIGWRVSVVSIITPIQNEGKAYSTLAL